jgi:TonB family protein
MPAAAVRAGMAVALSESEYWGGAVSLIKIQQVLAGVMLISTCIAAVSSLMPAALAQDTAPEELSRKVKIRVPPVYPEIARRMNITGAVKVSVVVSPSGTVKSTKVIGGHPILVSAAVDAVKKWRFETASSESSGVVEIKFAPQD